MEAGSFVICVMDVYVGDHDKSEPAVNDITWTMDGMKIVDH